MLMIFSMDEPKDDENVLTEDNRVKLHSQNSRLVDCYRATQLENNAKKFWDLFYKRNETRFFKDRHWSTREFNELLCNVGPDQKTLLEVGCGVGNFVFPLIEENTNFFIYACDLSPRAIALVTADPLYEKNRLEAFQCDITTEDIHNVIEDQSIDIVTLIFVLSAIHPEKYQFVMKKIHRLLKPGGIILFRDYGLYDMTQIRFKAGHKISENFYMRQDGTRSYFFSLKFVEEMFTKGGFVIMNNAYVHRRTVNKKENVDVPRVFAQCKASKKTAI